jgi:predicted GIY-YIG superfamily endonuclease
VKPGAFYLVFDVAGEVYVGCTTFPERRFQTHARDKTWWPEVVRIEVVWHTDQTEARRAESMALYERSFRHCNQKPWLRYLPAWGAR